MYNCLSNIVLCSLVISKELCLSLGLFLAALLLIHFWNLHYQLRSDLWTVYKVMQIICWTTKCTFGKPNHITFYLERMSFSSRKICFKREKLSQYYWVPCTDMLYKTTLANHFLPLNFSINRAQSVKLSIVSKSRNRILV